MSDTTTAPNPMQRLSLASVPAKQGYVWFRQGIWLFRKNPMVFLMLLFLYIFVVQLAVIVPFAGVLAVLFVTPGLSVGFMTAARLVIKGERVGPSILLVGFRHQPPQTVKRLLQLGGVYCLLVFLLSLIASTMVDFRALLPILLKQAPPTVETIRQLYLAMAIGAVLYTPIAMLLWFSPVLVAWYDTPPFKALFFSWLACWRNRAAFFTYASIWALLLVGVPFFLEGLLSALGLQDYAMFIVTPYSMGMLTVLYCSFYATWRGCFAPIKPSPFETDEGV